MADDECHRIVVLDEGSTRLVPHAFSGSLIDRRDNGSVRFLRNTRVWHALYVSESGDYRLAVRGRCQGPGPAQMRVWAHGSIRLLEFGAEATEQYATIALVPGYNALVVSFVNDSVTLLGDRNLEILEIRIERLPH